MYVLVHAVLYYTLQLVLARLLHACIGTKYASESYASTTCNTGIGAYQLHVVYMHAYLRIWLIPSHNASSAEIIAKKNKS